MDPFSADIVATGRRETLIREAENERVARAARRRDHTQKPPPQPRPATRPATA